MRRLGQLAIPGFADRRDVPYATLSLTMGHDRKLYYGASGREFDYAGSTGLATAHLIVHDLNTGKTEDLGEMLLEDGRRVLGTNAADTGPDGTIYMVGAIEVRPEAGKPVEAAGKIGDVHFRLALLIYRPRKGGFGDDASIAAVALLSCARRRSRHRGPWTRRPFGRQPGAHRHARPRLSTGGRDPAGESAVRALAVAPNGAIYGVTSGKRSHLFALFPQHGYVQPLGFLKGVTSVGRSLVISANGDVYIGAAGPGGSLYRYTPKRDEAKPIRVDAECGAADLGAPVPEGGIHALAIDRVRDVIYGVSRAGAASSSATTLAKARFTVHGKVAEGNIPGEQFERHKNLGRAIVVDAEGRVYVSGEDGAIFRFDLTKQTLEKLSVAAPTVLGREPYNGVDAWARAE